MKTSSKDRQKEIDYNTNMKVNTNIAYMDNDQYLFEHPIKKKSNNEGLSARRKNPDKALIINVIKENKNN